MRDIYKKLIPKWWNTEEQFDLVLSNDIDSLASCCLLKKYRNWNIRYFYDFKKLHASKQLKHEMPFKKKVFIDVAVLNGKAIDNHVSTLSIDDKWNPEMINLNAMHYVSKDNYTDKYCGSTLLEVWSLLDVPLPSTEKGMMALLAIDTTFKGFYYKDFHEQQRHYLVDVLGFDELYECVKRHNKDDFYDMIDCYQFAYGIWKKDNGRLSSWLDLEKISNLLEIDITLPDDEFIVYKSFEERHLKDIKQKHVSKNIFSFALCYENKAIYSKEIK